MLVGGALWLWVGRQEIHQHVHREARAGLLQLVEQQGSCVGPSHQIEPPDAAGLASGRHSVIGLFIWLMVEILVWTIRISILLLVWTFRLLALGVAGLIAAFEE